MINKRNNTLEIDTTDALRTADAKIADMKMILKTMIPENDAHTRITEYEPTKIKVFADTLMTYKIPCLDKPSPCKI